MQDAKRSPVVADTTGGLIDFEALQGLAADLRGLRRVLVITGAGMSADSGLPTYRGSGGLYRGEVTEDGIPIEQALSGTSFRRDPALCWKYLRQVEEGARGRQPHAGHRALARLDSHFERLTVLTQNVDGFHQRAGQREVIEIHGNLQRLDCTACPHGFDAPDYIGLSFPPACSACGGILRPRVVLFGEALPKAAVAACAALLSDPPDAVISVGTTSVFPYIAAPVVRAAQAGRLTAEINPEDSRVSGLVRYRIRDRAAPALAWLLAQFEQEAIPSD